MQKHTFIAGDWGTSNLRLYLCEWSSQSGEQVLEVRHGKGIKQLENDFEETFFELTADWFTQHGKVPVILSGMVGSNIGWKEAPYLRCPLSVDDIVDGRLSFTARGIEFSILAGLKTSNPLGLPDVMRGEELQILGWAQLNAMKSSESRLFILPGTHNKWVLCQGERIKTFLTAFTGELYGLLREKSVLIAAPQETPLNQTAFMRGVAVIEGLEGGHLPHTLFSTRSLQVLGEMSSDDAPSYLSGLITASDVVGATALFLKNSTHTPKITIIGEPILSEQYKLVLNHFKLPADDCNPADAATAAYQLIYRALYHSQPG